MEITKFMHGLLTQDNDNSQRLHLICIYVFDIKA